ncbi:MAG: hypothetical protein IJ820_06300 [Lachnospiraceae bacterium]|nr:hypothetical protein [Lachnospiraceae bacterium]
MSYVYAMKGYRDARNYNNKKSSGILEAVRTVKSWFDLPVFNDLSEAQRRCVSASEMNSVFEKWGR